MKRILLVNPWIEDVSAYDYWLKPLGLLYISSILKSVGIDTVLIDCLDRYDGEFLSSGGDSQEKYYGTGKFPAVTVPKPESIAKIPRNFKRFGISQDLLRKKLLSAGKIDGVMLTSMMTYWYHGVRETARVIRETLPEAKIVLGGVYPTLMSEHARSTCEVDLVCSGTGMKPLRRALDFLKLESEVPEGWFDELEPDYSHYFDLRYVVLLTSLGCPFECTYCASHKLWDRFKFQDAIKTANLIEKLAEGGPEDFVFFDDAILCTDQFKNLLRELARRGIKKRFHLPNGVHSRLLDEETASLMFENNFKSIKLGLETTDPTLQLSTGGKVTSNDFIRAVKNLFEVGFTHKEVSAYIMVNLPSQKEADVLDSLALCEELRVSPSVNEFTPIPGTKLWKRLVSEKSFEEKTDPLLLNNSILPYWWKGGMDQPQVQRLKERAWQIARSLDGL